MFSGKRKAFGKKLEDQPVVRYKIANMAREVETTHAFLESLAFRIVAVEVHSVSTFSFISLYSFKSEVRKSASQGGGDQ